MVDVAWPTTETALAALQTELAEATPWPWSPTGGAVLGASYVCFARGAPSPGAAGDPGWAAAALKRPGRRAVTAVVAGPAGAAYRPGLLALREGPLRAAALGALAALPDVVLVDATGRDHPRRAGLALHLGAVLGVPTVGVTDRPLVAAGAWPADRRGAAAPLLAAGELVGYWLRTRPGVRPLAVHAAWRTDAESAVEIVLAAARRARTPQPLREARRAARAARGARGQSSG